MHRKRFQIDVSDSQTRVSVDPARLEAIAAEVLAREGVVSAEISVALIDGATMRQLNRRHLNHDYDTDVLSFLLDCQAAASVEAEPRGTGKAIDGEILISTDIAASVADEFGWSVESEVVLYLVHGLLHLIGYDDLSDEEQLLMRDRERFHLQRWNLSPVYAETAAQRDSDSPRAADATQSSGVRD